ncbi:MAG: hypothetical protein ACPIOQ_78060, partial [Promethearchaeia archaeon]
TWGGTQSRETGTCCVAPFSYVAQAFDTTEAVISSLPATTPRARERHKTRQLNNGHAHMAGPNLRLCKPGGGSA